MLGVGTILTPSQVNEARDAGAKFLVTPGTTEKLARAVAESGLAALPGAGTISEMVALLEMGFHELKFFPAEAAGGVNYLKSVAGPLADLRFCPTGGIGPANAETYLGLPNVLCVGGTWLTPKAAVTSGNWAEITRVSREAAALGRA